MPQPFHFAHASRAVQASSSVVPRVRAIQTTTGSVTTTGRMASMSMPTGRSPTATAAIPLVRDKLNSGAPTRYGLPHLLRDNSPPAGPYARRTMRRPTWLARYATRSFDLRRALLRRSSTAPMRSVHAESCSASRSRSISQTSRKPLTSTSVPPARKGQGRGATCRPWTPERDGAAARQGYQQCLPHPPT
jgi:hypothetical protein